MNNIYFVSSICENYYQTYFLWVCSWQHVPAEHHSSSHALKRRLQSTFSPPDIAKNKTQKGVKKKKLYMSSVEISLKFFCLNTSIVCLSSHIHVPRTNSLQSLPRLSVFVVHTAAVREGSGGTKPWVQLFYWHSDSIVAHLLNSGPKCGPVGSEIS